MSENNPSKWFTVSRRFEGLLWVLVLWAVAIFARLVWLQVLHHDELLKLAQQQQQKTVDIASTRGTIFDRTKQPLAKTLPAESISINPSKIKDVGVAADLLSGLLNLNRDKLYEKIASSKRRSSGFLWIKRKVFAEEADRVRSLKLEWVDFREENRRFYPRGQMASHMVGSVGMVDDGPNADDKEHGTSGIEMAFEEDLSGRPGKALQYTDVKRNPYDSVVTQQPQAGTDITLTIDPNLQFVLERELDKAMASTSATRGTIVAIDPYTGQLRGVAIAPRFDPNQPPGGSEAPAARADVAIGTPFEPGSVFKIVTLAAGIESKVITPDTPIWCYNGAFPFKGRVIHDTHNYGTLTAADVFAKSSNIGAIQIALKVGEKVFYEYVRKFGFGSKTGIDLPGESAGMLRKFQDWQPGSIGSVAMGHEVSATAIQLALAGAVIANGGTLLKPQIILSRQKPGGPVEMVPQDPGVRIIKPETAIVLRQLMEGVVLHGTGKAAVLTGYTSGGKTGSAQIYDYKTKTYTHTYNSSFVGFAPVTNPQIVIAVTLNGTSGGAAGYGGAVAAPVFREAAMAALRMLDVPKDLPESLIRSANEDKGKRSVSSVTQPPVQAGSTPSLDVRAGVEPGLSKTFASMDGSPEPGPRLDRRPFFSGGIRVPDFRGKTLRAVLEESAEQGFPVEVAGNGLARTQEPPPGAKLPPNGQVKVQFGR